MSAEQIETLLSKLDNLTIEFIHCSGPECDKDKILKSIMDTEKSILEFKDKDINRALSNHISKLKKQLSEFNDTNKHLPIDEFVQKNRDIKILIADNQWKKEDNCHWITFR